MDKLQKLSDDPLKVCPACGEATLVKQVTAAGFQLKGSGWYVTDFKGGGSTATASANAGAKSEGQAQGPSEAKPDAKSDNTSAAKPATEAASAAAPAASSSSSH